MIMQFGNLTTNTLLNSAACLVIRGNRLERITPDCQSRGPEFGSRYCRFEVWEMSFVTLQFTQITNEYLTIFSCGYVHERIAFMLFLGPG